jgi:hypothetical protein
MIRRLRARLDNRRAQRRHDKYLARRAAIGMAPPHKLTVEQMDEMARQDGGFGWAARSLTERMARRFSGTGWPS